LFPRSPFFLCTPFLESTNRSKEANEIYHVLPDRIVSQMLDSQLATLEEPEGEDGVVAVDISRTPAEITKEAVQKMVGVSKPW
jgi:gluconate kinase